MARMRRELSLVLIGAGLLTAGFFFIPEPATSKTPRVLRRLNNNYKNPTRRVAAPPTRSERFLVSEQWRGRDVDAKSRAACLRTKHSHVTL